MDEGRQGRDFAHAFRFACYVVAGLGVLSAPARGEEEVYFADLPVVLSVSRLAQPLAEAPGAVTVIDQELIRASGARQLSDVMRLVPGMQVTPRSRDAGRVTYHGLSEEFPSRLQVLVDGRSQYSPLYQGGVNWNLIPVALEDIERIEVLRGSNSAAYGANAFLGVINIITLSASQARGASASVSSGSGGLHDTFVRWGGGTPGADFRMTFREQQDNGLDKVFDDRRNQVFDLRADLHVSDRDEVQLNFGNTRNVSGSGKVTDPCDPAHEFHMRNTALSAGWRRAISADSELKADYTFTDESADDSHLEICGSDRFNVNYGGRARRHDLEVQHILAPAPDMRLAWGGGLHAESVRMPFFFYGNVSHSRQSQRLFANLEWQVAPRWLLNLGGTLERDSLAGSMLAPRAVLHRHLDEQNTVRVGVSRAFRPPSLFEAKGDWRWVPLGGGATDYDFMARQGLLAERVDSREIGYIGEFRPYRLSLDVRAFEERIPNRIQVLPRYLEAPWCTNPDPTQCDRADYAANGEAVKIRGIEYQLRWQPLNNTRLLLNQAFVQVRAHLLDVEVDDDPSNLAKISRHTQASAPSHNTTLMLMQKLPYDLELAVSHYYVGDMRWTRNTHVASYHRADWRLARRFQAGGQSIEVAYTGRSSIDSHPEFRDSQVVTPRHFVSMRLDF